MIIKINSYKSNVFLAIITYLPKIQPEARGSKIGMIKINSYKSNVGSWQVDISPSLTKNLDLFLKGLMLRLLVKV